MVVKIPALGRIFHHHHHLRGLGMSSVELPGPARAAHAPMSPRVATCRPPSANLDLRISEVVVVVVVKKTSPN